MSLNKIDLSIIIPCFNEFENINIVLNKFIKIVNKRNENIEVIVIDGGSTDNTQQKLKYLFQNISKNNFKLILNEKRKGYGADIMKALSKAKGEVLSWTHADLQTDPKDVLKAYDEYKRKYNNKNEILIKGERINRKFIDNLFTFGMQIVVFFVLQIFLKDINAQPKLFGRNFYETCLKKKYPEDFSLDLYALYKAKSNNSKIYTIPVLFKRRIYGEAKGGGGSWKARILLIKRTLKYIFKLKKTSVN